MNHYKITINFRPHSNDYGQELKTQELENKYMVFFLYTLSQN